MVYLPQWEPFKNDEKCPLFHLKDMVNFKIYDVTIWLTKIAITYCPVSHEVKATRQRTFVS